jgi:Tol biopolymer transport system component
MNTKLHLLLILFLVNINTTKAFQIEQNHKILFEKAKYCMETKGDLKEAITLFDSLIRTYPDEREYAANAQFHIGLCYEKLGNQTAQKAYQDVIKNYADQSEVVKVARQRLSQLILLAEEIENTPISPKFTKIKIPTEISWNVALSPDGQKLLLVYDEKLWLMPLAGNLGSNIPGKPEQLNTDNIPVEWTGLSWSADGKWIAFNDILPKDSLKKQNWEQSIYVVPSGGGNPKKVYTNFRDSRVVNYRISLTPDGKNLAFSSVEDNKQHIYRIPVEGGVPTKLTNILSREPVFSPDGKMIAFVEDQLLGVDGGDLMIMPATGGSPSIVAQAVNASSPLWSPDGSKIAFLDYSDDKKIFIIPVNSNGKPSGKKIAIDAPEGIEDVRLLTGWSPDNKIGALMSTKQEFGIYTLPEGGGQAAMVYHGPYSVQPRWTPDGQDILFMKVGKENPVPPNHKLSIVSAKGGKERDILIGSEERIFIMPYEAGLRVSPDGEKILVAAKSWDDTVLINNYPTLQIWTTTIEGKNPIQLTNPEIPYTDSSPYWSPDGKSIVFLRSKLSEERFGYFGETGIYTVNASGEELKLLISESDKWVGNVIWSPDGTKIAYLTNPKNPPKELLLNVINVESGELSVIGKLPKDTGHRELAWSPDSKRVAFKGHEENDVIKIMSLDDGSIEYIETGLVDTDIHGLDWSPDGKSLVFVGFKAGKKEFWFLEDFLPLEKLVKETKKEPEGIRIKQIWKSGLLDDIGTVSADGKLRSCVDWGEGDVAIQDLKNGEIRVLSHNATLSDTQHFVLNTAISKNGKQIASCWWNPDHTYDLMLSNVDNSSQKLIYKEDGVEVYPMTWLSDDELITIRQDRNNEITYITIFNVLNDTFRDLKKFDGRIWFRISSSPDEKYIAYDIANSIHDKNFDINVISANGSDEISLVNHPANDRVLGWVPGRQEFLFVSDRSGSWDIWALPLNDGQPEMPAKRIYTNIGEIEPMGFTDKGDCYFGFSLRSFQASIAPFNMETGELKIESGEAMLGSNFHVKWSPDGQNIAYIKEDNKVDNPWQLVVKDLNTGKEHKLADNLFSAMDPNWSPDGNSILLIGRDKMKYRTNKNYKGGVYIVDMKTGKASEILQLSDYKYNKPEDDKSPLSRVEWSHDGESIFYLFFRDRLVKRSLETGEEKILFRNNYFNYAILNCSPDGKNLLFAVYNPEKKKSYLLSMPLEGGETKKLCTSQEADDFYEVFWSPDGKYIYFTERIDGTKIWRIPAEGGNPLNVWQSPNRIEMLSISPKGDQMSYSHRERTTEVRKIENLVQELEKIYDIAY